MTIVSPRVDIAFKKIFGVEENKDLLISLVNSMMSEEDQVANVTLLNPYNPKSFQDDKLSILDIKAKSLDGRMFNIEIQISDEADYDKRALYYWAKLYTEQLQQGDDYSQLAKAIGIHILNFTSIPEANKYHNVFHVTERDTGFHYFKELELHTVELTKFSSEKNKELSKLLKKVKTSLDMWATFLTNHDLLNKDNLPRELENDKLKKALTVLEVMNFNAKEKEAYDGHLKWLMIESNTLKKYEQKGRKEGIEEGRKEGIEEGRKQMQPLIKQAQEAAEKAKTEAEQQKAKDIAAKLLLEGSNPKVAAKVTGLPLSEIEKLMERK